MSEIDGDQHADGQRQADHRFIDAKSNPEIDQPTDSAAAAPSAAAIIAAAITFAPAGACQNRSGERQARHQSQQSRQPATNPRSHKFQLWLMCGIESTELKSDAVGSFVPKTAIGTGIVAVAAAFASPGLEAIVSLRRRHPMQVHPLSSDWKSRGGCSDQGLASWREGDRIAAGGQARA
jgi:hypothetical protein